MSIKDRSALVDNLLQVIEEHLGFGMGTSTQIFVMMQLEAALSNPQCNVFELRQPKRPRPW